MKNIFTVGIAVIAIALGAICIVQHQKLAAGQTQLGSIRQELDQKGKQLEDLQASKDRADQQRNELAWQASALAGQLQARSADNPKAMPLVLSNAPAQPSAEKTESALGGFGAMLSKMMEDPDMKQALRDQQRLTMDPLYGALMKKMGLTPAEAEKFKDLLADNMLKSLDRTTAVMGSLSSTNRTEMLSKMGVDQKNSDAEIRAFLGDARYSQYQDYQQTISERTQLNQFKQQTAGGTAPITDLQTEQLIGLMKEEKQTIAAATGQAAMGGNQNGENVQAMLSDDQADKMIQAQTMLNERVIERAKAILSPEQLDSYGKYQSSQLQMLRLGMTMARKMLVPDQPGGASVQPGH